RALVRGIRVIQTRNRIDAELGGRALMTGIRRDDGEATREARVRKRSGVAADGRRDGAVVAAAALVEKPSAPGGRQTQFEARLVRLAVDAHVARRRAPYDAMRRLRGRSGLIGRGQRHYRQKLPREGGREGSTGRFARAWRIDGGTAGVSSARDDREDSGRGQRRRKLDFHGCCRMRYFRA